MKKIFFFFLVISSQLALGQEIKIMDLSEVEMWGNSDATLEFEINEELGRAWVNVTISRSLGDSVDSDEYRVKIPGLSFDTTSKVVNLDYQGQIIECAKLVERGRWIFRQKIIQNTGRCKFAQKWIKTTFDDGFEIQTRNKLRLTLNVE